MISPKDKAKDKSLYETYGITLLKYEEMYDATKGCCYLCDRYYPVLYVDHRHVVGYKKLPPEEKAKEVRGLLCFRHNKLTIGGLEIDKNAREILERVIAYFSIYPMKGDK